MILCHTVVMKYKRTEEDGGRLMGKLNKFSIHSIRKKSDRLTGYLKILTGVEPQVNNSPLHLSHSTLSSRI